MFGYETFPCANFIMPIRDAVYLAMYMCVFSLIFVSLT